MAGMAANISAFNTVFTYDLYQDYVVKDRHRRPLPAGRPDRHRGRPPFIAIGTSYFARRFSNIMDYLQTLFGFFNAPLFATFILGMFWKRMTAAAGWIGLVAGTLAAVVVAFLTEDAFGSLSTGVIPIAGQGAAFLAASVAFIVDVALSFVVSLVTKPKPRGVAGGLVYSETPADVRTDPKEASYPWYRRTVPPGLSALAMVIVLNMIF